MAEGPAPRRDALIAQFSAVTGATAERARFYLEAAAWDLTVRTTPILSLAPVIIVPLQLATDTFFSGDSSHEVSDVRERGPVQETGVGQGREELVPAISDPDDLPPLPPAAAGPVAQPASSHQKRTGCVCVCVWREMV